MASTADVAMQTDLMPADDTFPNDEADTIQWRDVPRHTWLRVTHIREVTVEDHNIKILTLLRRDCRTYASWTTEIISKSINAFLLEHTKEEEEEPTKKLYIKSLGKTTSKSNPTYGYYNFRLKLF